MCCLKNRYYEEIQFVFRVPCEIYANTINIKCALLKFVSIGFVPTHMLGYARDRQIVASGPKLARHYVFNDPSIQEKSSNVATSTTYCSKC